MDTVFVNLPDSLLSLIVQQDKGFWQNKELMISVIALLLSFISFVISFFWNRSVVNNMKKKDINDKWAELAEKRIKMWKTLEIAYSNWSYTGKPAFDELVKNATIPKVILDSNRRDDYLKNELRRGLPRERRILYVFGRMVYGNKGKKSILNNLIQSQNAYNYDAFYENSSTIIWYVNGWSETTSKYLKTRFRSDIALFHLFTWFELALKRDVRARWSDRTYLFKVAYAIDKKNRK